MTARWQLLPGAPVPGRKVLDLADFTGAVCGIDLDGYPLLLVRSADGLRAYVNACPHQHLPLDWRSFRILSADGRTLRCSNHDAGFDAATGQGFEGFGAGCALTPVPIRVEAGAVVIGVEPEAGDND